MKIVNLSGKFIASLAVFALYGAAFAADNTRSSRSTMPSSARMLTMPIVSLNTVGNPAVTTIETPAAVVNNSGIPSIIPTPTPDPKPECADGKAKNSAYTSKMCLDDLKRCINNGGLQGGIKSLYNANVRNSIVGGMRLCQNVVDKCVSDVRENCRNVYASGVDVWMNFNCSVVQPEYYNFVLRKTGLTPNQAENVCLLLDRNTYGSSFAAVSDKNAVNEEYGKTVGAYNKTMLNGNVLAKVNPQGEKVNIGGVNQYDANRGHYARWDAENAECLIRVGAYNKDKQITNSWLFGAAGDDKVAEVWQRAGSSFTCNKDLFGFSSLLNDTKTAAVIAVPGGAVLGAAIGAGAGAGVYKNKKEKYDAAQPKAAKELGANPCTDPDYRKNLGLQISNSRNFQTLQTYLYKSVKTIQRDNDIVVDTPQSSTTFASLSDLNNMTDSQCEAVVMLFHKAQLYQNAVDKCLSDAKNVEINSMLENYNAYSYEEVINADGSGYSIAAFADCTENQKEKFANECLFKPLQVGLSYENDNNPLCNHDGKCKTVKQIQTELSQLNSVLAAIEPVMPASATGDPSVKEPNKGKEIGKGVAIGAVTGAAAGGLATGITALVERGNISCKLGDGLDSVGLGKTMTVGTLKDFYVKWGLYLPDTGMPSADSSNASSASSLEQMCFDYFKTSVPTVLPIINDEKQWTAECASYDDNLFKCPNVKFYYKSDSVLVENPCEVSGEKCILNKKVFDEYYKKGDS